MMLLLFLDDIKSIAALSGKHQRISPKYLGYFFLADLACRYIQHQDDCFRLWQLQIKPIKS